MITQVHGVCVFVNKLGLDIAILDALGATLLLEKSLHNWTPLMKSVENTINPPTTM